MKAMKFRVHSPEHSELIQKRLFELGYKWGFPSAKPKYVDADGLVATSDGRLLHTFPPRTSPYYDFPEATLDDLYAVDPYAELKEAYVRGEKIEVFTDKGEWAVIKHWTEPALFPLPPDRYRIAKPKTITLEGWSPYNTAHSPLSVNTSIFSPRTGEVGSVRMCLNKYEVEVRKDGVYHKDVGLVPYELLRRVLQYASSRRNSSEIDGAKVEYIYRYKVGCSEFDREEVQKAYDAVKELR